MQKLHHVHLVTCDACKVARALAPDTWQTLICRCTRRVQKGQVRASTTLLSMERKKFIKYPMHGRLTSTGSDLAKPRNNIELIIIERKIDTCIFLYYNRGDLIYESGFEHREAPVSFCAGPEVRVRI